MSFSRWQKLMAARMPIAVPPAAPTRGRAGADSFNESLLRSATRRKRAAQGTNVPESAPKTHLSYWGLGAACPPAAPTRGAELAIRSVESCGQRAKAGDIERRCGAGRN